MPRIARCSVASSRFMPALITRSIPPAAPNCGRIMELQGHHEPTGYVKVTRGYNLPARFVLHTVGPIIEGQLQPHRQAALANSYRSCLDLAREIGSIRSVALCAISTRVFGSPKRGAAESAARTVGSSPRDKSSVYESGRLRSLH